MRKKLGSETTFWLLSLLLATDPTAFTTIHSTIPAEGSTMFGQRAFVSSTDLPETHLNITINQSGPASGPTAGPSGQKEVSAAAGVPELVSLFLFFPSDLFLLFHFFHLSDLTSCLQFAASCVGSQEFNNMPFVLLSVKTADCVSYFKSVLLNVKV